MLDCISNEGLESSLKQSLNAALLQNSGPFLGFKIYSFKCVGDSILNPLCHVYRWTGRVYRPKDLAMMKVSNPGLNPGGMSVAAGGRSLRSSHPIPGSKPLLASPGSPILEVFVRPQAATGPRAQRYLHQAVSLRLPTMEEVC